jgi:hypothetical protein
MITINDLNEVHRRFWAEQTLLRGQRIADEAIRETAFARLMSEQARRIPVYYQATLEQALADVEHDKKRFLSQQARQGGRAKTPDALQQAILDLVRRDPHMTEVKLKGMLTRERSPDLIEDVDEETISFMWLDGSGRRRSKPAAISGLKHRLWRARKALKSR